VTSASSDASEVVASSIRAIAAGRLGRAFLPVTLLVACAAAGFALGSLSGRVVLGIVLGAPFVVGALLVMGQGAVRHAAGWPSTGLWAVSGAAWLVPWGWGVWALVVAGVLPGRVALGADAWLQLAVALACGVLAARVLRDSVRIGGLRALADAMIVPAPEEE
jgi:hypothetical protein